MTREEANKEAKKLAEWEMQEFEKLLEEYKEAGKCIGGLDSDKRLFPELHEKVKKRLEEINNQIE